MGPGQQPGSSLDALLGQAVALHQQGYLAEAQNLYRSILTAAPVHFHATHLLGVAHFQSGSHDTALALIERAIAIDSANADAHYNHGLVLQALDRPGDALASYNHALQLNPHYAFALNNRGNVLRSLKRPEEALTSFERSLAINPGNVEALNNCGVILRELNRLDESLACYDQALRLHPNYVDAINNRGNVLCALGRQSEALANYDQALHLVPGQAEYLNNRGAALRVLGRHSEALADFDRALQMRPAFPDALNNRGNVLRDLERRSEATEAYDRALALRPEFLEALNNRGKTLLELKRFREAEETFARLLELSPNEDFALGYLTHMRLAMCDWTDYRANTERIQSDILKGEKRDLPFPFLVHARSASAQLQCARIFAASEYPAAATPLCAGSRTQNEKIRIAYVSADFHTHATAYLMAELFERHDRSRFENYGISFGPDDDSPMRTRIVRAFDRFLDVRALNNLGTAQLLANENIDVAVDLKGFTQNARAGIFSHRAAPIQVSYLGFPGTMGTDYIDYIIADPQVIPPALSAHYHEKIVRLPECYQPNDRKRRIAERVPARAELGLPQTGFVFCSFNNNYKIAPDIFDIWMRLLSRIDGSVLWLLQDNAEASNNLVREAAQRGIPSNRLIFAPRMELDEHLARHVHADLFLDTFPCTAHTTASDALWAGLPLLTCMGETFASRVAGSLLHNVGLPELATATLADYEALAFDLATSPGKLAAIKTKLIRNRANHPLFDTDRLCRHLESAFVTMVERHRLGIAPASFDVAAI